MLKGRGVLSEAAAKVRRNPTSALEPKRLFVAESSLHHFLGCLQQPPPNDCFLDCTCNSGGTNQLLGGSGGVFPFPDSLFNTHPYDKQLSCRCGEHAELTMICCREVWDFPSSNPLPGNLGLSPIKMDAKANERHSVLLGFCF